MVADSLESKGRSARKCCWVGGSRYSYPLDESIEKKFSALRRVGEIFVIGFSTHFRASRFTQHARFYLLPRSRFPALRYLTFLFLSPIVILWLVRRYGVNILVAQSPYEGFSAAWAKIFARIIFKKHLTLIVESHGDFEHFLFLQRKIILSPVYKTIMKRISDFALRRADALRAISKTTRKQLEVRSLGKPIVQFPTWTDIEIFLKAGEQEKTYRSTQTILFVGHLVPGKGVDVLIESFAHIAQEFEQAKLVVIGKAEDKNYEKTLKMQSKRPDLEDRITFLGHLTQYQVARHMAEAAAVVVPSLSEGLGRVVFEAMACGTAVIGSRVGGIPELIQDNETGFLVSPGDALELAGRLKYIFEHPEKARQMGNSGRKFGENFFSEESYIRGYSTLLEKSLAKDNSTATDNASPLV